ncbi:MAG: PDZ domain-containing protein [Candidatus Omnitrophota bacterium]
MKKACILNFRYWVLGFAACWLWVAGAQADTVYLKGGAIQKGLVVDEYADRFIFSTPDGEEQLSRTSIDEIFFDEPYRNYVYLGKKAEGEGDFSRALQFYRLALEADPGFVPAQDAIQSIEEARWRYQRSWKYRELKEMLHQQLGMGLTSVAGTVVVSGRDLRAPAAGTLEQGDILISCWATPLTRAGLKRASLALVGLSNTAAKLTIERELRVKAAPIQELFAPVLVTMEYDGPTVKSFRKGGAFESAGLAAGDIIVKIDGRSTRYMTLAQVRQQLFSLGKDKILSVRKAVTLMRKKSEDLPLRTAVWAWHSKELLLNDVKRAEFFDFCSRKEIGIVFFQLQYQFLPDPHGGALVCRLLYPTRLKDFLRQAHARGLVIYALDGASSFCLEREHYRVLAQVASLLAFNREHESAERFDGVHYDNEPYTLPGFQFNQRQQIIDEFLALNRKIRQLITDSGALFEFGIDVPFWLDEFDGLDRKLVDICDNVGIMDYRNFSEGPDGIIEHALPILKYASQVNKKVFVGVETSRYPKQEVFFVSCLEKEAFNRLLTQEKNADVLQNFIFEGFGFRVHSARSKVYLGLVKPAGVDGVQFERALAHLGGRFGRIVKPADKAHADDLIFDMVSDAGENVEFRDVQCHESQGADGTACLLLSAREEILEKLTFAGMSEAALVAELALAKKAFAPYPAFAGFAIHHYKSYKEICERKQ